MSEWSALFQHVSALLSAQPIHIQLTLGLFSAFLAVMMLEGLRLTFLPRRRMIRYLQLHAPNSDGHVDETDTQYDDDALANAALVLAQPSAEPRASLFRSTGSRRAAARSKPRALLESGDGDAA
jgi:hypothetical protein